jgi:hypothetical protein
MFTKDSCMTPTDVRQENMSPAAVGTKNCCAGDVQQQFPRPDRAYQAAA